MSYLSGVAVAIPEVIDMECYEIPISEQSIIDGIPAATENIFQNAYQYVFTPAQDVLVTRILFRVRFATGSSTNQALYIWPNVDYTPGNEFQYAAPQTILNHANPTIQTHEFLPITPPGYLMLSGVPYAITVGVESIWPSFEIYRGPDNSPLLGLNQVGVGLSIQDGAVEIVGIPQPAGSPAQMRVIKTTNDNGQTVLARAWNVADPTDNQDVSTGIPVEWILTGPCL